MNSPATSQPKRIEWTHVQDIEHDGVVARITSTGGFRPRYSITIGRIMPPSANMPNAEPRLTPHFGIFIEGQGVLYLRGSMVGALERVVSEAEDWILAACQKREDEIIEQSVKKETKQVNFGKPVTKATGKTEREREKRKNKLAGK